MSETTDRVRMIGVKLLKVGVDEDTSEWLAAMALATASVVRTIGNADARRELLDAHINSIRELVNQ